MTSRMKGKMLYRFGFLIYLLYVCTFKYPNWVSAFTVYSKNAFHAYQFVTNKLRHFIKGKCIVWHVLFYLSMLNALLQREQQKLFYSQRPYASTSSNGSSYRWLLITKQIRHIYVKPCFKSNTHQQYAICGRCLLECNAVQWGRILTFRTAMLPPSSGILPHHCTASQSRRPRRESLESRCSTPFCYKR